MASNRKLTDFFRPYVQEQGTRTASDFKITISPKAKAASQALLKGGRRSKTPSSPPKSHRTTAQSQCQELPEKSDRSFCSSSVRAESAGGPFQDVARTFEDEESEVGISNAEQRKPLSRSISEHTSFTAISSQTLPSSSARKITSSGEVVVQNSDSEEGDSDSSLEDIDELVARKKAASALASFQSSSRFQDSSKPTPPFPTQSTVAARKVNHRVVIEPESQRSYKFNLGSLVNQFDTDAASKERIERAKNALDIEHEEAKRDEEARKKAKLAGASEHGVLDESCFTSVVDGSDGEEDPQRVMAAMRRTEALQQDLTWHFFDDESELVPKRQPFPSRALPETGWMTALKESFERQQACLTGFVRDMAKLQELPSEIISWMLDEVMIEPRDDIAYAYMRIIEQSPQVLKELFTTNRFDTILDELGAKEKAKRIDEMTHPTFRTKESFPPVPPGLCRLFEALKSFAKSNEVSAETRSHALKVLLRLGMDDSVRADGQSMCSLEDTIVALFRGDETWRQDNPLLEIGVSAFATTQHAQLRLRILQCIPNVNSQMEDFRRRLALCFFLNDEAYLSCNLADSSLASRIVDHLRTSPLYDPNPQTDYTNLGALVSILDISIGFGFVSLPFSSKDAEADFNRSIDVLSQQVTALHNGIIDTGASHMKRTEAKNALERLKYRLEFSVRTKPKPKKNVFGEVVGKHSLDGYVQDANVMMKFLDKEKVVQVDVM
ncbi:MAG: hypothetical protein Q9165_006943 [Trypethelium subeluteriae]